MKPCDVHSLEELADLASGRLDGPAAEALREHVAHCLSCQEASVRLATLDEALRRSEAMQVPDAGEADRRRVLDGARRMLADEAAPGATLPRRGVLSRFWNQPEVRRALAAAAVLAVVAAAGIMAMRAARGTLGSAVARAIAVRGSVNVAGNGASAIHSQQTLHVGQRIRTGRDSMLTLALTSGGAMDLNESTALVIERSEAGQTHCRLDQGQMFVSLPVFAGERRMADRRIVLDTSVARIEAAAAEFDVRLVPGSFASRPLRRGGTFVLATTTA
jgi:hypothetical protein